MIMGYVCNLVPEDDGSARLESLLISLFCLSEWGGSHLIPLSPHRDRWVRPLGGPAWEDLELDGPWILHGNSKELSWPAFLSLQGWTLQCFASLYELRGKMWNHYLQNKRFIFLKNLDLGFFRQMGRSSNPSLACPGGWRRGAHSGY